jgi:8-oxo-dGTP diphosphatase
MLVHRPRYDDWTFPKGKVENGETDEECARREVEEETGMACELLDELPSIRYRDRFGRPKVVRYWRMALTGGTFAPSDEVDAVEWLSPTAAAERLSYARDGEVLTSLGGTGGDGASL